MRNSKQRTMRVIVMRRTMAMEFAKLAEENQKMAEKIEPYSFCAKHGCVEGIKMKYCTRFEARRCHNELKGALK